MRRLWGYYGGATVLMSEPTPTTLGMNLEWVTEMLSRLDMVEWDRFVEGEGPPAGEYIHVYGWIDREEDEYKDFVMLEFLPDTEENLMGFTTSSDKWTHEIHRRLFDAEPDDHNPCQRVENHLDIENAVQLEEQQSLSEVEP